MNNYPLISCICITNSRAALLLRSIQFFKLQDYPNKQLVISYPENDPQTQQVIDELDDSEIQIIAMQRKNDISVGDARNQAIRKADGEYICCWDDDDWYHSTRLSTQLNCMRVEGKNYQASIITRILLYDVLSREIYLSFPYPWEGTLMARKFILLQNQYKDADLAEDSHVVRFLSSKNMLCKIDYTPYLYIYIYHGENSWHYQHFEYFMSKSERLTGKHKEMAEQILDYLHQPSDTQPSPNL